MKLLKNTSCFLILGLVILHGNAQAQSNLPARKIDSVQHTIKRDVDNEKAQLLAPLKALGIPSDSQLIKNMTGAGKAQLQSVIGAAGNPLQQLSPGVKLFEGEKPIAFNEFHAEADYTYFQDSSGMGTGVFGGMQGMVGYNIGYTISLASMPFNMSIRENNGINTMQSTPFSNFYKFNFDHQKYVENIRKKVLEKISPDAITNSALSRVNSIRHNYEQQLQHEIGQIQREYSRDYKSTISLPVNATNLSATDMGSLRTQLLSGAELDQYKKESARLQTMANNKDGKTLAADSGYLSTLANVKRYETMEKIYSRITVWNKRFQGNPVVKELMGQSSFSPGAMKNYLSNPQNLGKVLDDQASLSTMQKLFYNIKKLDMGQNAAQSGDLAIKDVINTGVNTEFKSKSSSFGIIYGKNNSVNNWQQAGLTSQVTNEYSNLTGFKIGTGSGSPVDQSISFNTFHFNNNGGTPGNAASYLPMAGHQDAVISLHTGMQLAVGHSIVLDLSKSFGSFSQNVTGDSVNLKPAAGGSVLNNAGKANYAGMLSYSGQLFNIDFKLFVKKIGLGYNNPGNALLRAGESQMGLGLSRKFLQKRITVKYDGDYRKQVFDPANNYIYTAYSNKLQVGYKFNRNDRVSMTYQRSDFRTEFYGQPSTSGNNSRIQIDGSYRFVIARKKIMNNITLSRQEMDMPLTTGGSYLNNSLLFTNTSSMMISKNLLSLTILANRSDNKAYYFNTSLYSTEANYSYTLSGTVRMASSLGYYANYGWNRQVGIRQQISAVLKKNINIDVQTGYKKAIQITQPLMANQLFVNATMHYTFK